MKKSFVIVQFIGLILICLSSQLYAERKLKVVTATADLADLVKSIGGDRVEVISLSKGNQDPHYIEPRPSMVMQVKNAGMLVRIGMDLDLWVQSLIDAAKNPKVMYGGSGYVDASEKIVKLEVPTGKIDASMGDIHIYGNPHYWLDPENAKPILELVVDRLGKLLPSEKEYFQKNHQEYLVKLNSGIIQWQTKIKPLSGEKIVTYHNSWPYFANQFGLKIVDFIEPKPGIPPTPSHIVSLITKIRKEKVKLIVVEPYLSLKTAEAIAKKSGAKLVVLPPSVGGVNGVKTYLELFEYNVDKLVAAMEGVRW